MKTNYIKQITVFASMIVLAGQVGHAATLKLSDGSSIEGEVQKIHEGTVYIQTQFAGVLEISKDLVTNLESDAPVALRVESGEVFQGPVSSNEVGSVQVASGNGTISTSLDQVVSGWQPGEKDPIVLANEAAMEGKLRKWSYLAGLNITGSDGNTDTLGAGFNFSATLEGPDDRLNFYSKYKYQETEGIRSEDELIGGVSYTNFFTPKTGWYVREELERDPFEDIDFRSTTALGLVRRLVQQERLTLEGRAGLSYRHEAYSISFVEDGEFPGLDFGLDLGWQFADWGKLSTSLTYVPSIEDFSEYLVDHESGVDVPLGTADYWVMRFGVGNRYNSKPLPDLEKMDTTYFIRMILNWK